MDSGFLSTAFPVTELEAEAAAFRPCLDSIFRAGSVFGSREMESDLLLLPLTCSCVLEYQAAGYKMNCKHRKWKRTER